MITYNEIYEAARKEKLHTEQLQKLPKNFIPDVADYLREKKAAASKEESDFPDVVAKTKKQLENAGTVFRELMRWRRKKLLNLVLIAIETGVSKQDFENMIDAEKELFEKLVKIVDTSDKKINSLLNGITDGKKNENNSEIPNQSQSISKGISNIIFKEDVEEFVDFKGNKIGPFKKGEKANLSEDISKILVEDGEAEVFWE